MSFEALVADVFRHGCGVSMHTVLQSNRYHRIRQELAKTDLVYKDDTALVETLGITLADRAYQNMPLKIRQRIGEWNNGVEAQITLLHDICLELNSHRWHQIGSRSYAYNSDNRCVLPATMGSWEEGTVQPNCLGVAQMMIGFARRVKARYGMVNVVQSNQDTLKDYKLQSVEMTVNMFMGVPGLEALGEDIRKIHWELLETLSQPDQAHHLLVIQIEDGGWIVVDPYLTALYKLDGSREFETARRFVAEHHDHVAVIAPRTPVNRYINTINTYLHSLEFACRVFEGCFGSEPELIGTGLHLLSYVAGHITLRVHEKRDITPQAFAEELPFLEYRVADPDQDTQKLEEEAMLALVYAIHDIDDIPTLNATISEDPEGFAKRFFETIEQAAEDRTLEKGLAERTIRYIAKGFLAYLDDLEDDVDTRQHECLEVTWAPMAIGIATLNHLQGTTMPGSDKPTASLQGKLSAMYTGQWVLYDTLARARQEGETISLEYLPYIVGTLERLQHMSHLMIPPFRFINPYAPKVSTP